VRAPWLNSLEGHDQVGRVLATELRHAVHGVGILVVRDAMAAMAGVRELRSTRCVAGRCQARRAEHRDGQAQREPGRSRGHVTLRAERRPPPGRRGGMLIKSLSRVELAGAVIDCGPATCTRTRSQRCRSVPLPGWPAASTALPLAAASGEEPRPRTAAVSGQGEVSAEPDLAYVTLGVESRQPTMDAARAEVAATVDRVLALCRNLKIDPKLVNATRVQVQPEYSWNRRPQADPAWLHGEPPGAG
jgi:hypothetical protein